MPTQDPGTPALPPEHPPGAPWSIADAASFLGVSDRHLHRLIDQDAVKTIRLGRRRLIPDAEVARLASGGC
jgi:excisionase family DNA binding protein